LGSGPRTKLERKLTAEFTARYREEVNFGAVRQGTDPEAQLATTDLSVSCIQRGSGNEFSCALNPYEWGERAGGPPAPTAQHPDRRRLAQQSFSAVMDPDTERVQYDDVDPAGF
jgi:hypothetical protein